ncbi:hypothetical protein HYH03_014280 [Edaphochlamys debaryana]|uniref:Sulfotransferase n=1 Tax=Edaphochlamys debaryana TaxID=47281 RepID=A0A835XNY4_9CHLO|nr:hypothetical protein HYH03_014280 [Edaphochlamys debaryana]|eukprot:KAG2487034.1 hypothetical protein HYH03_014280 [Edaphochlamys debaryana]
MATVAACLCAMTQAAFMMRRHEAPYALDFAVVGQQKSGTSTLWMLMSSNPALKTVWKSKAVLVQRRIARRPVLVGDWSATHLSCPCCPEALKKVNPGLKIVVLLRDPIERARSRFREQIGLKRLGQAMKWAAQPDPKAMGYDRKDLGGAPLPPLPLGPNASAPSFAAYVAARLPLLEACLGRAQGYGGGGARGGGDLLDELTMQCLMWDHILGFSVYDTFLSNYWRSFSPKQARGPKRLSSVLVSYTSDLARDPLRVVRAVEAHIGTPRHAYSRGQLRVAYNSHEGGYGWACPGAAQSGTEALLRGVTSRHLLAQDAGTPAGGAATKQTKPGCVRQGSSATQASGAPSAAGRGGAGEGDARGAGRAEDEAAEERAVARLRAFYGPSVRRLVAWAEEGRIPPVPGAWRRDYAGTSTLWMLLSANLALRTVWNTKESFWFNNDRFVMPTCSKPLEPYLKALKRVNPGLKVVVLLRDPIERARSRFREQIVLGRLGQSVKWAAQPDPRAMGYELQDVAAPPLPPLPLGPNASAPSFAAYVAARLPLLEACLGRAQGYGGGGARGGGDLLDELTMQCLMWDHILGFSVYDTFLSNYWRSFSPKQAPERGGAGPEAGRAEGGVRLKAEAEDEAAEERAVERLRAFYGPSALKRVNPGLKIVILLRDPIERTRSRFREQEELGLLGQPPSSLAQCQPDPRAMGYELQDVAAPPFPPLPLGPNASAPSFAAYVAARLPLLEACLGRAQGYGDILGFSVYDTFLSNYWRSFSPKQARVLVSYTSDLARDPLRVVRAVEAHIGAPRHPYTRGQLRVAYNSHEGGYGWACPGGATRLETDEGQPRKRAHGGKQAHAPPAAATQPMPPGCARTGSHPARSTAATSFRGERAEARPATARGAGPEAGRAEGGVRREAEAEDEAEDEAAEERAVARLRAFYGPSVRRLVAWAEEGRIPPVPGAWRRDYA